VVRKVDRVAMRTGRSKSSSDISASGVPWTSAMPMTLTEMSTLPEVVVHFKERGGFVWVQWCGDPECEARIKAEAGGVTIRSIDPDEEGSGKCLVCGQPAKHRVALARAY